MQEWRGKDQRWNRYQKKTQREKCLFKVQFHNCVWITIFGRIPEIIILWACIFIKEEKSTTSEFSLDFHIKVETSWGSAVPSLG